MGEHEVVTQGELTKTLQGYEKKGAEPLADKKAWMEKQAESHGPAKYDKTEEMKMSENSNEKTTVNVTSDGGGRGGSDAAMIAALLNGRNQDGYRDRGGMDNMWAAWALLNNRRDDCDRGRRDFDGPTPAQAAILQTLMEGVGDIKAAVPTIGLETQNAILSALARDALGTQQGLANVKDSVQTGNAFLDRDIQMVGANVSLQGSQTREWVTSDGEKTRGAIAATLERINSIQEGNLQRELAVAQAALAEERGRRHAEGVEVRVTQNVNQQQAQAQAQVQFATLFNELRGLAGQVQRVKADNDVINFGSMLASGNQATTSTQVR